MLLALSSWNAEKGRATAKQGRATAKQGRAKLSERAGQPSAVVEYSQFRLCRRRLARRARPTTSGSLGELALPKVYTP